MPTTLDLDEIYAGDIYAVEFAFEDPTLVDGVAFAAQVRRRAEAPEAIASFAFELLTDVVDPEEPDTVIPRVLRMTLTAAQTRAVLDKDGSVWDLQAGDHTWFAGKITCKPDVTR